jgi:hypothetical protein
MLCVYGLAVSRCREICRIDVVDGGGGKLTMMAPAGDEKGKIHALKRGIDCRKVYQAGDGSENLHGNNKKEILLLKSSPEASMAGDICFSFFVLLTISDEILDIGLIVHRLTRRYRVAEIEVRLFM